MLKQRPFRQHKRKNSEHQLYHPKSMETKKCLPSTVCQIGTYGIIENGHHFDVDYSKDSGRKVGSSKNSKNSINTQKNKSNNMNINLSNLKNLKLQNNPKPNDKTYNKQIKMNNIVQLISNSQRKLKQKYTVVENIEDDYENVNVNVNDENIDRSNGGSEGFQKWNYNSGNFYTNNGNQILGERQKSRLNNINGDDGGIFCFGKNNKKSLNVNQIPQLDMEEIMEVPDTMSCQKRYKNQSQKYESLKQGSRVKQYKSDSFQKFKKNFKAQQKQIDITNLSSLQKDNGKKQQEQNMEPINFIRLHQKNQKNPHKMPKKKKQSLNNYKTNSTMCLSQKKSYSKQKSKNEKNNRTKNDFSIMPNMPNKSKSLSKSIHLRPSQRNISQNNHEQPFISELGQKKIRHIQACNEKMNKQIKMLWECMGELWQNNRISRYISERNKLNIQKILKKEEGFDANLINMKAEIIRSIGSSRY